MPIKKTTNWSVVDSCSPKDHAMGNVDQSREMGHNLYPAFTGAQIQHLCSKLACKARWAPPLAFQDLSTPEILLAQRCPLFGPLCSLCIDPIHGHSIRSLTIPPPTPPPLIDPPLGGPNPMGGQLEGGSIRGGPEILTPT